MIIEVKTDPTASAHALRWRALDKERVTLVAKVSFSFASREARFVAPEAIDADDLAPYLGRAEVLFRGRPSGEAGGRARLSVLRGAEMLLDKRLVAAGPISWQARASSMTDAHRAGLAATPIVIGEGFPWSALQTAPPDQQLASLACGDDVLLENLVDGAPSVRFRVPAFQIRFELEPALSAPAPRIDRVCIDGERRLGSIVLRAVLPLAALPPRLVVRVVSTTQGAQKGEATQETADVEGDPSTRVVAPFPLGAPKEAPEDTIAAARALWKQSGVAPATQPGSRRPKTATLDAVPAAPPAEALALPRVAPVELPMAAASVVAPPPPARRAPSKPKGPSLGDQFRERAAKAKK